MTRRDLLFTAVAAAVPKLERVRGAKPRNIVLILSDDHRWDAMGAMGHPFLKTPGLDRMASEGALFSNTFCTTSLCSPSRATILTGSYAHAHGVVDNGPADLSRLTFFPQYLQAAGYETGFVGKWHMGSVSDAARPGFDHWVSFRGQGTYLPSKTPINVNGKHVEQKGYITDELTDYAADWLRGRGQKPFFLMLSHKAVHSNFLPAERHRGCYEDVNLVPPPTQADTPQNYFGKPRWVKTQRNSTHGVDFPDQRDSSIETNYRRYCESVLALDDSVARMMEELDRKKILDSTLFVYLSDNGFAWGEHGLQDKRTAYEESIRVPLLARCPELFPAASRPDAMVLTTDIAPSMLAAAGLRAPGHMDGGDLSTLAQGRPAGWRGHFLYEYFWERSYPQTPTIHAIRTDRYKYVRYHGIWDSDELYDIRNDPGETRNLVADPAHRQVVDELYKLLWDELESRNGMQVRLRRDAPRYDQVMRKQGKSGVGEFPPWMIVP